jgi:methionine-S-sulfoxide reductase
MKSMRGSFFLLVFFFVPSLFAAGLEKATFAAGCFWGTQEFFRKVPGVVSSQVGYTGGSSKANYNEVSGGKTGHAESLELEYDPKKVSYKELLTLFFKMHDPTTLNQQINDKGTQYRSAIFFHNKEQEKEATDLMKKIEKSGAWKKKLTTEVKPAGVFYRAEPEHQDYLLNNKGGYDNHFLRKLSFE